MEFETGYQWSKKAARGQRQGCDLRLRILVTHRNGYARCKSMLTYH